MHQNNLSRDISRFFTNTMMLHFFISDGDRHVFHGDMIIVIRVFHHYFTSVKRNYCFQSIKFHSVPTMTLCFKAVVNIGDEHLLNLDKFHLTALKLSIVFNFAPAGMN